MNIPEFSEFLDSLTDEKIKSFNIQSNVVKLNLDENGCIKLSSVLDRFSNFIAYIIIRCNGG